MATQVLVKFTFPVAGLKEYATDDEAAAIALAQEEFKDKKDLTVEIYRPTTPTSESNVVIAGEPTEDVSRASDVRPAERDHDSSDGNVA